MAGRAVPYRDVPWMWSDQHDAHIQMAGFDFTDAEVVSRGVIDEGDGLSFFAVRDGRLVAACGASLGTGIARSVRAARLLIEAEVPIDATLLDDPQIDLRRLAREHLRPPVARAQPAKL
jgi:3-phenylpropionate/trans-cinnamate dioxygenase ferredoxin reductase subunit